MRYPTKQELIDLTRKRAEKAAAKLGTTAGQLMKEIVNDRYVLIGIDGPATGNGERRRKGKRGKDSRRKSISLDMYQRIHDGLAEKENEAA